jgi:hypothetical protein
LKQQKEHCQALDSIDTATIGNWVQPLKQRNTAKYINKHEQPENVEDEELSDAESISSNDSGDLQELPRNLTATTPRDKATIADHTLCDNL